MYGEIFVAFDFTEAGIDEEMLRDMNDEMVKDLFKNTECGFKAKFMKRFEKWKNDIINPESDPPTSVPTIPFTSSPNSSSFNDSEMMLESVADNENNVVNLNNLSIISYIRMLF